MIDVVIVGNGILGESLAFRLRRDDPALRVALVGPAHRPGSATLAAGAMLNVWAELSEGQFEDPYLGPRFELPDRGAALWEPFARELEEVTGQKLEIGRGTFVVNTPSAAAWGDRTWRYFKAALASRSVEHRVLDPQDVPYLAPAQDARPLETVQVPDGHLNPFRALAALDDALSKLGVAVHASPAVSVDSSGRGARRTFRTRLEDGTTVESGAVVLANGAFAQALVDRIPSLRREVPRLLWGAGSGLKLRFPAWVPEYQPTPLWDMDCVVRGLNPIGACGLHIVPRGEYEYYVGASSAVLFDIEWNPRVHSVGYLLHDVVREFNRKFAYATVELVGNGFRPVTIDMYPLLGESNEPGLWFLNGMKRDGLTAAPYLARELAKELRGEKSLLPAAFRPARALLPYKNRETAIRDAVLFGINADRQHDLRLPPWMDEKLVQQRTDELTALYDRRKLRGFGVHPEVTHLYENDRFYAGVKHRTLVS